MTHKLWVKWTIESEWQKILEINVEAHRNRNYLPNVYNDWMHHPNRRNLVIIKVTDDFETIIGFFSVCWYESGDRTVFGTVKYFRQRQSHIIFPQNNISDFLTRLPYIMSSKLIWLNEFWPCSVEQALRLSKDHQGFGYAKITTDWIRSFMKSKCANYLFLGSASPFRSVPKTDQERKDFLVERKRYEFGLVHDFKIVHDLKLYDLFQDLIRLGSCINEPII